MKKSLILILSTFVISCALGLTVDAYSLKDDIDRAPGTSPFANNDQNNGQQNAEEAPPPPQWYANGDNHWEYTQSFYPDATIDKAIKTYKKGNYSGCLQELISVNKKNPYNPLVLYYLGMTYAQIGWWQQAVNAYEAVMHMNPNETLTRYATKGRDCLVNGPACYEDQDSNVKIENDFDRFVNGPYGNGLSDEVNQQMKEQKLRSIERRIKSKDVLEDHDIDQIQQFDKNKSEADVNEEKIAMADTKDVSNEDVLAAIETLKKAGVTVSINPYQNQMPMNDEYTQLSMMLGTNNYNNNNSMMNMLPMLMTQNKGQIDPQVIQSMMMNSMLPDFTFNDNKKDY